MPAPQAVGDRDGGSGAGLVRGRAARRRRSPTRAPPTAVRRPGFARRGAGGGGAAREVGARAARDEAAHAARDAVAVPRRSPLRAGRGQDPLAGAGQRRDGDDGTPTRSSTPRTRRPRRKARTRSRRSRRDAFADAYRIALVRALSRCSDVAARPLSERLVIWQKRAKKAQSAQELATLYDSAYALVRAPRLA